MDICFEELFKINHEINPYTTIVLNPERTETCELFAELVVLVEIL